MVGCLVYLIVVPDGQRGCSSSWSCLALLFGFLLVIPIGAADMPVVIALLNSYAGLADAAMGFVLMNKIQIITGSLDGTSGFLLSLLMCRAMNRSAMNVLFGAFGKVETEEARAGGGGEGDACAASRPRRLAVLFDGARSVIIVPGYGMAVAQAQHGVSELAKLLEQARHRRQVRHPPRGRPHARAHERAPGRGQRPLRPALRDGADQPVLRARPTSPWWSAPTT